MGGHHKAKKWGGVRTPWTPIDRHLWSGGRGILKKTVTVLCTVVIVAWARFSEPR